MQQKAIIAIVTRQFTLNIYLIEIKKKNHVISKISIISGVNY